MANIVEYIDEYGDRYLTTITDTAVGKEILTQIYSTNIYRDDVVKRIIKNGRNILIEAFGSISTTIDIIDHDNNLLISQTEFELDWIEVWNSCVDSRNKTKFKYNLNNSMVSSFSNELRSGSSFVSLDDTINDVVWGDVDPSGNVVFEITGDSEILEFIDVW